MIEEIKAPKIRSFFYGFLWKNVRSDM